MKLITPEKTTLLDVTAIKADPNGLLIEGKIMSTMPMKAILTPRELRGVFKIMNARAFFKGLAMLIRGS